MRLADGALLCVDAAEGVMLVTDKVIKQAVAEGLPICLLLTKVRGPSWQGLVLGVETEVQRELRNLPCNKKGHVWACRWTA